MHKKKVPTVKIHDVQDLPADKLFQLAEQKNEQMNYEDARYYYEKALSKDPENDAIVLCYADFLKQNNEEGLSKQILQQSLKQRPQGNYKRYFQLAELYDGVQSIELFERGIQAAKSIKPNEKTLFRDVSISQKQLRRDIANAYAAIAEVCLTDLLEVKEAEGKCLEALKLGYEIDNTCLDVELQSANYLLFRDDTEGARTKLLKIYNSICQQKNKLQVEDEQSEFSEELKTQTAKYLLQVECYKESIELLTEVNESTGKDQEVLYLLAFCSYKAKNYPECLNYLEEYDGLLAEGEDADAEIAQAAQQLRTELQKLDPKMLEEPNDTGVDAEDDEWMDVQ